VSTALSILPGGYVVVGSVPSGPGGALPSQNPAGCLIVLNSARNTVETWSNPDIDGPWDMTTSLTKGGAEIFLSNVLSGSATGATTSSSGLCTVVRIDVALPAGGAPMMTGATVIGSGLPWRASKAAFVLGPTGDALSKTGTLYVAETLTNQIIAIPEAATRTAAVGYGTSTLTSGHHLNAPLGLSLAPDGDIIVVNGNDGNAVEISPQGRQILQRVLVAKGAGDLFGVVVTPNGRGLLLVNDGTNALDLAKV
jgi:DNA-binding beta-propeller fold protein YncE